MPSGNKPSTDSSVSIQVSIFALHLNHCQLCAKLPSDPHKKALIAVPHCDLKLVSLHVEHRTELEGTYSGRTCRGLKILLIAGGYAGDYTPYDRFDWQYHFLQGRQLVTWQYMEETWPAEFQEIVSQLLPGMLDLLQHVRERGQHELSKEEAHVSSHVHSCLFFLAAFLQNSAFLLYEHPDSPIYMDLEVFRQDWFRKFHSETFSPVVRTFQKMAEAVSEHLLNPNHHFSNVLQTASDRLGYSSTQMRSTRESMQLLCKAYSLVSGVQAPEIGMERQTAVTQSQPQPALHLPATNPHMVALPSDDTLRCWWHVWQEGHIGYQPLRDYFSQTKPKVGKPKFLNSTKDSQKVVRRQYMLWELEKQIEQGHQKKDVNADKVIKRWDALIATKACGIKWSVPKLAQCFRALAETQLEMLVTDPACRVNEPDKCKANVARAAFVQAFVQ